MREIRASDPNYRGVKCADCGEYLPFLFDRTCTYCTMQKKDRRIAELEAQVHSNQTSSMRSAKAAEKLQEKLDSSEADNERLRAVYEAATKLRDRIEPRSKGGIADEYYALDAALAAVEDK